MEQRQCAGCVAIAECDQLRDMRCSLAERRDRSCDVRCAVFKAAISASAVTDPTPVIAEYGVALTGKLLRHCRLSGISPAADFIAAADDQQTGRARTLVKRADKPVAFAVEIDHPPHEALQRSSSAASDIDITGSSCGSARNHNADPSMSDSAASCRLKLAVGKALSSDSSMSIPSA